MESMEAVKEAIEKICVDTLGFPKEELFKNRVSDNEWHTFKIEKMYDSKKAVSIIYKNFKINLRLFPLFTRLKANEKIEVWGAYLNKCADGNIQSYTNFLLKKNKQKEKNV